MQTRFWRTQVFLYVSLGCGLFVILTAAAMAAYPGGLVTGEPTTGYDFFRNFFSDLGRLGVAGGRSNLASAILFSLALSIAGIGLILFFLAFRDFFKSSRGLQLLSSAGTLVGIFSGICFAGIAFAPYDIVFELHYRLVFWAFRAFFVAVGLYACVIFRQGYYPRRYGWIFVVFSLFLAGYIGLLELGPGAGTPQGSIIQATGQKVIIYVSILSVMMQSWLAFRFRSQAGI